MTTFLSVDHFREIVLPSTYMVLLLVWMLRMQFASSRLNKRSDFAELLDEFELVGTKSLLLIASPRALEKNAPLWKTIETKETLRRMAGNARVLVNLAGLQGSYASPWERKLLQEVHMKSVRLRFCAHLVRLTPPYACQMLAIRLLLEYIEKSYWTIVRRLHEAYTVNYSQRYGQALKTACNLTV